jgi:hypothetical protein
LHEPIHVRLSDKIESLWGIASMEPLTALSVAAAVGQFVDFGFRILIDARELYKSSEGAFLEDIELSKVSQDLTALSEDVECKLADGNGQRRQTLESGTSLTTMDKSGEIFVRLCCECKDISQELLDALSELQAHGTTKLELAANSLLISLKAIWTTKSVESLKECLNRTRQQTKQTNLYKDPQKVNTIVRSQTI